MFVWEFISCILAKVATFSWPKSKDLAWELISFIQSQSWNLSSSKQGFLLIFAQGFHLELVLLGFLGDSMNGFVSIFVLYVDLCLHSIVSPLLLLDINYKVKWMLQVWVWSLSMIHAIMLCKSIKSLPWSCGLKAITFMLKCCIMQHENPHNL